MTSGWNRNPISRPKGRETLKFFFCFFLAHIIWLFCLIVPTFIICISMILCFSHTVYFHMNHLLPVISCVQLQRTMRSISCMKGAIQIKLIVIIHYNQRNSSQNFYVNSCDLTLKRLFFCREHIIFNPSQSFPLEIYWWHPLGLFFSSRFILFIYQNDPSENFHWKFTFNSQSVPPLKWIELL